MTFILCGISSRNYLPAYRATAYLAMGLSSEVVRREGIGGQVNDLFLNRSLYSLLVEAWHPFGLVRTARAAYMALMHYDTSIVSIGPVQNQNHHNARQTTAFFSRVGG